MSVDTLIQNIIRREGGFVNHPKDRGGPTKFGITLGTLRVYRQDPVLDVGDVMLLSLRTAAKIYKQVYLKNPKIDQLQGFIMEQVFDIAVNSGPVRAIKMVQRILEDLDLYTGPIDGVIGPDTIAATAAVQDQAAFNNLLVDRRIKFLKDIIEDDPSQSVFRNGWIARAESFRVDVV